MTTSHRLNSSYECNRFFTFVGHQYLDPDTIYDPTQPACLSRIAAQLQAYAATQTDAVIELILLDARGCIHSRLDIGATPISTIAEASAGAARVVLYVRAQPGCVDQLATDVVEHLRAQRFTIHPLSPAARGPLCVALESAPKSEMRLRLESAGRVVIRGFGVFNRGFAWLLAALIIAKIAPIIDWQSFTDVFTGLVFLTIAAWALERIAPTKKSQLSWLKVSLEDDPRASARLRTNAGLMTLSAALMLYAYSLDAWVFEGSEAFYEYGANLPAAIQLSVFAALLYIPYVGWLWFSGSPAAKRHTVLAAIPLACVAALGVL